MGVCLTRLELIEVLKFQETRRKANAFQYVYGCYVSTVGFSIGNLILVSTAKIRFFFELRKKKCRGEARLAPTWALLFKEQTRALVFHNANHFVSCFEEVDAVSQATQIDRVSGVNECGCANTCYRIDLN